MAPGCLQRAKTAPADPPLPAISPPLLGFSWLFQERGLLPLPVSIAWPLKRAMPFPFRRKARRRRSWGGGAALKPLTAGSRFFLGLPGYSWVIYASRLGSRATISQVRWRPGGCVCESDQAWRVLNSGVWGVEVEVEVEVRHGKLCEPCPVG